MVHSFEMTRTRRKSLGETPPPPGTRTCAGYITQGKWSIHHPMSGSYEVCLTPNQYQRVFGGKPPRKRLGCGTFACAYDVGKKATVVKITSDAEDVAGLLLAQGVPHVAKVVQAHELVRAGIRGRAYIPVYALEVERLRPVHPRAERWINQTVVAEHMAINAHALDFVGRGAAHLYEFPTTSKAHLKDRCKVAAPNYYPECSQFIDDFATLYTNLIQRGVWWQDFHPGNFGVDPKGTWKALDLGVSHARLGGPLPQLEGVPRKPRKIR